MRQVPVALAPISNTHLATLSSTPGPIVPGFTTTNDKYQNVIVQNGYAYVIAGGSNSINTIGLTLAIYNVFNPAAPVAVGYLTTGTVAWLGGSSYYGNGAYNASINGNILYLYSSGSVYLYTINIQDPTNPYNMGYLFITNAPGSLYSGAYFNGYVYLATQSKGLTVVNVSNPVTMVQTFQEGGTTNKSFGVCMGQANTVYTTNFDTAGTHVVKYIKTWDISTQSTPTLINTFTFAANVKPLGVQFWNNTLFVQDSQNNNIIILDVSTRTAPAQLSVLTPSATFQVAATVAINTDISGKTYAYVNSGAHATKGVATDFYDITNLSVPVLLQTTWNNIANSVSGASFYQNGLLYSATYGIAPGNLSTLDISSGTTVYGPAVPANQASTFSTQINVTDSSTLATVMLQGSNDSTTTGQAPANFSNILSATVTNANGSILIPKQEICNTWVRTAYATLGTGTVSGNAKIDSLN